MQDRTRKTVTQSISRGKHAGMWMAAAVSCVLPSSGVAPATQTITKPQHGITITYPDAWTAGTALGNVGIINYNEKEHPGPLAPEGGAIIRIRVMPNVAPTALAYALGLAFWLPAPAPAHAAQTFSDQVHGFTIECPDGWTCGALPQPYSPVGAVNFPDDKAVRQHVPMGGAVIRVIPLKPNVDPYAELRFATRLDNPAFSRPSADGKLRADLTVQFPPFSYRETHIALSKAGRAFRFMIEYRADDPNAQAYEQTFMQIVDSLKVQGPAATPAPPAAH